MDLGLIREVAGKLEALSSIEGAAAVGFDGFTDTIVRVVSGLAPDRSPLHFTSKLDFGKTIADLGSHNSSFELTEVATKIGGNGPNTAHALGRLGIHVDCIGMLGHPDIHALFRQMDANCVLHSYAEPTQTTALEFDDGKVLLAGSETLRSIDWPAVRDTIGLDRLIDVFGPTDIVGFTNWGEIEHATEIWEGVARDVLAAADPQKRRIVLFDLADPTKRDRDIDRLMDLVGGLTGNNETVLCLNRNEALAVARHFSIPAGRLEDIGAAIHAAIRVHTLIVRDPRDAMAWTGDGLARAGTFYVALPRLSTGGGDNFNAGYCFARLAGLDTRAALVVASAVAGLYVATGDSPTRAELVAFLTQQAAPGGGEPMPEAAK